MKKTVILVSVFLIACFFSFYAFSVSPFIADASGDYLRVITSDTPVYEDRAMTKLLFYLPYTYYVKILSVEGETAHIEYAGNYAPAIDGYVKYESLFSDGLEVDNPYPAVTVKTSKTAIFYSDAALTSEIRYVFPERNLYYYGNIPSGDSFAYCVSYNGNLGYVKEDSLYPFTVPDHPNELTFLIKEQEVKETLTETEEKKDSNPFVLRIIVIGCLIFAGVIAAFTIRKPQKTGTASYYDENDFG